MSQKVMTTFGNSYLNIAQCKSRDSGLRLLGFKSWLCPYELLDVCHYLISLCLSFLGKWVVKIK